MSWAELLTSCIRRTRYFANTHEVIARVRQLLPDSHPRPCILEEVAIAAFHRSTETQAGWTLSLSGLLSRDPEAPPFCRPHTVRREDPQSYAAAPGHVQYHAALLLLPRQLLVRVYRPRSFRGKQLSPSLSMGPRR